MIYFRSCRKHGALAQLGARLNGIQKVRGSTPLCSTKLCLADFGLQDILFAGVMELADVPDSKSGGSDTVPVRPRSPAPNVLIENSEFLTRLFSIFIFYIKDMSGVITL